MEGFLLTLKVTTGTSGGYQLGGKITPTAVWPTNKAWTIVWHHGCHKDTPTDGFCHLPPHLTAHPT